MIACPVPRLNTTGTINVSISIYRGFSYSKTLDGNPIVLYVVGRP